MKGEYFMTKKKEDDEVEKTSKTKSNFDLDSELTDYPCSTMLKRGFKSYIESKNITIRSKSDFTKKFNDYLKMNIGG